jgi:CHASE2 domain-containing sensor protein/signal transduction histidine kinase
MWKKKWLEKLSGLFYALMIALGVSLLSFFEAFTLLDEWAYDLFERLRLKPQIPPQVLVVEAPQASLEEGDKTWLTLLNILEAKNAKQIVFTFMPKNVSSAFYCKAYQQGDVFFGRTIQRDIEVSQNTPWEKGKKRRMLQPLPNLPENCQIRFGVVDIPPHTHGIHRQQHWGFEINQHSYPALEVVAADHFISKPIVPVVLNSSQEKKGYRVHFGKGLDEFPQVKLERILAGGLVSELVNERSVLIGLAQPSNQPGLHSPLAMTHNMMISMLGYHALALNTLLNQEHITTFSFELELILFLVLLFINWMIYQRLTIHKTLRVTLILMGIYVVLAWFLYHYALIWLPLVEMLIAQSLLYLFDFQYESLTSDKALRETLVESSFKIEERVNSESYVTEEYWSQVIVMTHDLLDLNRLIILECDPNQSSLKEIKALHCSLADIHKGQRRYNRKPYTTVIKKKKCLLLDQALLKPTDVEEKQYLIPLFFEEEIQGFWLLAIQTEKHPTHFQEGLKDLARQMGQSLYHRQQWLLRHHANQKRLMRYFHFESGALLHKALDKSITALEHRLSVLENLIADSETPTILYDVFGGVMQVNHSMIALSHIFDLSVQKMSALGFMMKVSQMEMENAQKYFRHILLEQGKIVQQVKLSASIERVYILHMQLFYYQEKHEGVEEASKRGVLCQLFDVTQMKLQSTLKEHVAERLIYQFRNDMQSILMATQLLISDKTGDAEKQAVGGMLQNKVNSHLNILTEVEKQLNTELDATSTTSDVETYPVDPKEAVSEAMKNVAEAAVERQVSLQSHLPELVSLVFAAPNALTTVISSILFVLIEDAVSNTDINISMIEGEQWLTYRFDNTGFGIPNQRFQDYLFNPEVETLERFKKMQVALEWVEHWNATLTGKSQVGEGTSFELRLRTFI